jgi:membrane-associated phospholipid phosphatase
MRRDQLLVATSAVALACFAVLARSVARRDTREQDHRFREVVVRNQGPVDRALAKAVGPLGKEWLHAPVALLIALVLWQRGAGRRAALPLIASISAELVNRLCEGTLHIRKPPPGKRERHKPSFPSGHALETAAVALTSSYVLAREGAVTAARSAAAAVALAAASGGGRVYLDRHWVSDSVGGYLLGVGIAAACGALYETGAEGSEIGAKRRSVRAGGSAGSNLQPQPA